MHGRISLWAICHWIKPQLANGDQKRDIHHRSKNITEATVPYRTTKHNPVTFAIWAWGTREGQEIQLTRTKMIQVPAWRLMLQQWQSCSVHRLLSKQPFMCTPTMALVVMLHSKPRNMSSYEIPYFVANSCIKCLILMVRHHTPWSQEYLH